MKSKSFHPLIMAGMVVVAVVLLVSASGPGSIGPAMEGKVIEVTEVPCE